MGAADGQSKLWNGVAGQAWASAQDLLDGMLAGVGDLLIDGFEPGSGGHVLDVGCGAGATTLALARRLGPSSQCVGVDISAPMIDAARAKAARHASAAEFVVADAQKFAFAPGACDAIVSRFGVMFFADPVAAFANLRRAARDGAALRLIAWRSAAENPFMTVAERAAAPLLPALAAMRAPGPGQFAFADAAHVRSILAASGWGALDISPADVPCVLPLADLTRYFTTLGPLGRMFGELSPDMQQLVIEAVRPAFEPYVEGSQVLFDAACWVMTGRAV